MGHVTILVQHAWKIQNSSKQKNGNPTGYDIDRVARGMARPVTAHKKDDLPDKPLAAYIRVTEPGSVAQLVNYYNSCEDGKEKSGCETTCQDILYRLEHMILQSSVPDSQRQKAVKFSLPRRKLVANRGLFIPKLDRRAKKYTEIGTHQSHENTSKYAAEARISVLMLARCQSKSIKELAMLLLCEALDTNQLCTSEHEIIHLQMLWVELVQMLRNIVDMRRQEQSQSGTEVKLHSIENLEQNLDIMLDQSFDSRIGVDNYFETLLTCLLLTLQRLDYAQDAGKLMQTSSLMDQSYDTLLEDFRLLKTTNPFIVQIMSSIEENVIEFQSKAADKYSSKEVALDVGISILSQVISVAKADFTYLDKQTCSILQGLQTEKKWLIGKKLIKIMATVAGMHMEGCQTFLVICDFLRDMHWQWQYLAVLCMGTIAISSQYPQIRKMMLEKGLIPLLEYGTDQPDITNTAWMIRSASIVALSEIYQYYHNESFGMLARESMQARAKHEINPIVLELLQEPKANVHKPNFSKRLTFLFKYTSVSCAEFYSEIQNEYQYMRKFIQAAEKDEKRQKDLRKKRFLAKDFEVAAPSPDLMELNKHHMFDENVKLIQTPEPTDLSTRKKTVAFSNLNNLVFTTGPYHQNYRKVSLAPNVQDSVYSTLIKDIDDNRPQSPKFGPSFVPTKMNDMARKKHLQQVGTANRRKLFNTMRPDQELQELKPDNPKVQSKSIHIPVAPIAVDTRR